MVIFVYADWYKKLKILRSAAWCPRIGNFQMETEPYTIARLAANDYLAVQ